MKNHVNTLVGKLSISNTRNPYFITADVPIFRMLITCTLVIPIGGLLLRISPIWIAMSLLIAYVLTIVLWWYRRHPKDYYAEALNDHLQRLRAANQTITPEYLCFARWLLLEKLRDGCSDQPVLLQRYDDYIRRINTYSYIGYQPTTQFIPLMLRTEHWMHINYALVSELVTKSPDELAHWLQIQIQGEYLVPVKRD